METTGKAKPIYSTGVYPTSVGGSSRTGTSITSKKALPPPDWDDEDEDDIPTKKCKKPKPITKAYIDELLSSLDIPINISMEEMLKVMEIPFAAGFESAKSGAYRVDGTFQQDLEKLVNKLINQQNMKKESQDYLKLDDTRINQSIEEAIKHFTKLLPCDKFIITGSYALHRLGLCERVTDLDVELYEPLPESIEILKRMALPQREGYPAKENYYKLEFNELKVDFFITKKQRRTIALADGIFVSHPVDIVFHKKQYNSFKHWLQLKAIAGIFHDDNEFNGFIQQQVIRYK